VYGIKACVVEKDRKYKSVNIYILSDSVAAMIALGNAGTRQNCSRTAMNPSYNWPNITLRLIWVTGHKGIVGNETEDQLSRTGSEHPFTGPEPA
jgi:ribonuclease HI